jgi:hypothetical protein
LILLGRLGLGLELGLGLVQSTVRKIRDFPCNLTELLDTVRKVRVRVRVKLKVRVRVVVRFKVKCLD